MCSSLTLSESPPFSDDVRRQWRIPSDPAAQVSYSPSALVVSDPPAESIAAHSKKLQDDLHKLGLKIKHHEDKVKYLESLKNNLDKTDLDMQVALGKYDKASLFQTKKDDPEHVKSGEETIANILKHENSGAAILCRIKCQPESVMERKWRRRGTGLSPRSWT